MQVVETSAAFLRQGVVAAVSETPLGGLDVATAFLGKGCYRVRVAARVCPTGPCYDWSTASAAPANIPSFSAMIVPLLHLLA